MDKEYLTRNYSSMIISVMCAWMAMFIYKYGDFLFLEMLPVLVSLLLFIMATSSFTKYFDRKLTGNLIVSVISIILGVLLIFVSKSIMYILFKITGIYIFVMILLDFIDYKKKEIYRLWVDNFWLSTFFRKLLCKSYNLWYNYDLWKKEGVNL